MSFADFFTANRQQHLRELLASFVLAFTLHFVATPTGEWVLPYHLLFLALFHAFDRVDCFAELSVLRYINSLTGQGLENALNLWQCIGRVVFQVLGAFLGAVLAPQLADAVNDHPKVNGTEWRALVNYIIFTAFFFYIWQKIPKRADNDLTRNLSFTTLLVAFTFCIQSVAPGAVFGLNLNVFRLVGNHIFDSSVSLDNLWVFIVAPLGGVLAGVFLDFVDRAAAPPRGSNDAPKAATEENYGAVDMAKTKAEDEKPLEVVSEDNGSGDKASA